MALSEKVSSELMAWEVYIGWTALCEEFSSPQDWARLEKAKWRKGELVFDELQKKLNIPPGDPFTVAKAIGDWFTKTGYAKIQIHKVSDTQIMYDMGDLIMLPILRSIRSRGFKVLAPEPSTTVFFAAFKKLCNMKAEDIPVPEELKASTPAGMGREMWRLTPLKKTK
ncbi:MAG: hypothetical protein HYY41_03420 [Chloroflexi bacterium]|nr:hypothetical protein [Chloroflexota bacterium]MBI2979859.1 hypothetical protein [Chloroflexota bacterium]